MGRDWACSSCVVGHARSRQPGLFLLLCVCSPYSKSNRPYDYQPPIHTTDPCPFPFLLDYPSTTDGNIILMSDIDFNERILNGDLAKSGYSEFFGDTTTNPRPSMDRSSLGLGP